MCIKNSFGTFLPEDNQIFTIPKKDIKISFETLCSEFGSHRVEFMDRQIVYRINENGVGPALLHQVFNERGWIEYQEKVHGEHGWNIWWRTTRFRTGEYNGLMSWQRINHYPNCGNITKKDALCRNLRKMSIAHGLSSYNFSPIAYNLPNDYTKFVSDYAKLKHQHHKGTSPLMWICKPAESSRGRGIFIFSDLSELQYDCNAVVQQYITDPLLIGGYKFDIRVYVLVPSFQPLRIYVHEEGLVRFSTEKYDLDRPSNVFAHLTNTSINKYSPGYTTDKEEVGQGCKWTISQLRRYFLKNNIPDMVLWQRVTNIITLTLLMQASSATKASTNCFELYGFDILVDSSLKPWLLEVNFSPALTSDCQADITAKKAMLHDLFDLIFKTDAELDFDLDMNTGIGCKNVLTGPTSKVYRTKSRLSVHHTRSTQAVQSDTSSSHLNSADKSVTAGNKKCLFTHSILSDLSIKSKTLNLKGNSELLAIDERTLPTAKASWWHEGKLPNSNIDLAKSVSNENSKKEASNSPIIKENRTVRHPTMDKSQMKISSSDSMKELSNHMLVNGNTGSPTGLSQNSACGKANPSPSFSHSSVSRGVTHTENPVEPVDSKTSTTSDSGISTLSMNSSDNNDLGAGGRKLTQSLFEEITSDIEANTNSSNKNLCAASDFNAHLLEQPPNLILSQMPFSTVQLNKIDILCSDQHKSNFSFQVVSENMRRHIGKKNICPLPPPGISRPNTHYCLKPTKTFTGAVHSDRGAHDISSITEKISPQTGHKAQIYDPCAAENKNRIPFNIPCIFSQLESQRFPYHHHYGQNPGKNGRPPLIKIPSRKVGGFFLVFPFNETTQKISLDKLEPKLVIKELQKHNKSVERARKSMIEVRASEDRNMHIWTPLMESG